MAGSGEKLDVAMADAGDEQGVTPITIQCKHGKDTHTVTISPQASVDDLKEKLHHLTNVLPRGQKLIFKGKILDTKVELSVLGLSNNAKVMMIGSPGLHQGSSSKEQRTISAPLREQSARPREFLEKLGAGFGPTVPFGASGGRSSGFKAFDKSASTGAMLTFDSAWEATGIISLRDRQYLVIPSRVYAVGSAARVLDLAGNSLARFPADVSQLVNLQKLRLSGNGLKDHKIEWDGIIKLTHLTTLALDHNLLTRVPSALGQLTELKVFTASHNKLVSVSRKTGNLSKLEKLDLSHNCLAELPSSLGRCSSLIEASFSANFLREVPSSFSDMTKLKVLNLDNNALKTFPSEVLKGCVELATLSLHGNELTIEYLRELEGWAAFDERRKAKHSKQLEFSVLESSGGFDEGADSRQWHHW